MRRSALLVLVSLMLVACSGTTSSVESQSPASGTPAPQASDQPTDAAPSAAPSAAAAATEAPTTAPSEGPKQYKPGDVIVVQKDGTDTVKITVTKVKAVPSYKGQYYTDKPKVKGDVFIQAFISYEALENNVLYSSADWQLFANGEAVDNFTILMNGPDPTLSTGTLPKGRKASGYVVYEVPAKGEVLLSYRANMFSSDAPAFEVKLR